ncbi:hypothetical protein ACLB2K_071105 [Fragaria x ananassa]
MHTSTTNPRHQQRLPSAHHQWECLDLVVVFVILDKLLEPIDLVRFGAVRKQWGRFAQDYEQWYKREALPMLLIPIDYNESSQEWRYGKNNRQPKHQGFLYSVSERRVYSNVQSIVLPSVSKPRSNTHCRRYYRGCGHAMLQLVRPMFIYGIPKVISLGDPTSNSGVQLIFSDAMSWIQVGGRQRQAWKSCQPHYLLDDPNDLLDHVCKFTDDIFYRGQIYMADCSNCGIVVDYEDLDQNKIVYASPPSAVVDSLNFPQRAERAYLVESIKGDLFYIRRFTKLNSIQMVTESFRVYKVVLNGSTVEYVEVKSIGDEAFFVGDSPSAATTAVLDYAAGRLMDSGSYSSFRFILGSTNIYIYTHTQAGSEAHVRILKVWTFLRSSPYDTGKGAPPPPIDSSSVPDHFPSPASPPNSSFSARSPKTSNKIDMAGKREFDGLAGDEKWSGTLLESAGVEARPRRGRTVANRGMSTL